MRMDWPDPGCAFAVVIILCRLPERLRSRQNMGMHEVGQTATGVEKDVVLNTRTLDCWLAELTYVLHGPRDIHSSPRPDYSAN